MDSLLKLYSTSDFNSITHMVNHKPLNISTQNAFKKLWDVLDKSETPYVMEVVPSTTQHINFHVDIDNMEDEETVIKEMIQVIKNECKLSTFNIYVSKNLEDKSSFRLQTQICVTKKMYFSMLSELKKKLEIGMGQDQSTIIDIPPTNSTDVAVSMNWCPSYHVSQVYDQYGVINNDERIRVMFNRIEEWKAVSILPYPSETDGMTTVILGNHRYTTPQLELSIMVNEPFAIDGRWIYTNKEDGTQFEVEMNRDNKLDIIVNLKLYWDYLQSVDDLFSDGRPAAKGPMIFGTKSITEMVQEIRERPCRLFSNESTFLFLIKHEDKGEYEKMCKTLGDVLNVFDLSKQGYDILVYDAMTDQKEKIIF